MPLAPPRRFVGEGILSTLTGVPTLPAFIEKLIPRKASKNSGIVWVPEESKLVISTDRNRAVYQLTEFAADEGRGFRLEKRDGTTGTDKSEESYSCFIPTCGSNPSCECKGFAYTSSNGPGHCKHLDSLAALFENRWLN